MSIDDLKIDELEHFAKVFRDIDLQFMRSLETPEDRLAYINGMLNTTIGQGMILSFRWQKLVEAVSTAFRGAAKMIGNIFAGAADAFRRIGNG